MKTKSEPALTLKKTLISRAAWLSVVVGIAFAALPPCLATSIELVTLEAEGYGDSDDEATVSALVEAVRQSRGLTVDTEKSLRTSLVETEAGQKLTVQYDDQIRSRTRGLIHSYEVLERTRREDRRMARLRVTMPQYRSPGADRGSLPTIAVLPFRANKIQRGPELARAWEQKLVTQLVQAGRFRVVDREFSDALDKEDARLRSADTQIIELERLRQQLNADYAVVGEITQCEFKRQGGANGLDETSFTVDYRILETATREVRRPNTVNVSYSRDDLEQLDLHSNERQAQDHLLNATADAVVTDALALVHPTKPGTLIVEVSPRTEYAIYCNGRRISGTDSQFALPAEREITVQVSAKDYESAERRLRLPENGTEPWKVTLKPGPRLVLDAATRQFNPTRFETINGVNYLRFGFQRVGEGDSRAVAVQGTEYPVEVANIRATGYDLRYKGQSRTVQMQTAPVQPPITRPREEKKPEGASKKTPPEPKPPKPTKVEDSARSVPPKPVPPPNSQTQALTNAPAPTNSVETAAPNEDGTKKKIRQDKGGDKRNDSSKKGEKKNKKKDSEE